MSVEPILQKKTSSLFSRLQPPLEQAIRFTINALDESEKQSEAEKALKKAAAWSNRKKRNPEKKKNEKQHGAMTTRQKKKTWTFSRRHSTS